MSNLLALHLRHATESEVISAVERSGGQLPGSREVAVCFADLVGFTRLGEEVPPDELGRLAVRLEALAGEAAEPPVRLVKTIGDAAMLASPEPEPLLDAALALIDAADAEGEDFPQLRAGAALGLALPRAGDWFGRPVNLASRITAIARPGSLLAERELRESTSDAYRWSFAGERRLRGIREPVALFRARAASSALTRSSHRRHGALARSCPQVVQRDGVLVGVHALPEALVAVRAQLARRRPGAPAARARARSSAAPR